MTLCGQIHQRSSAAVCRRFVKNSLGTFVALSFIFSPVLVPEHFQSNDFCLLSHVTDITIIHAYAPNSQDEPVLCLQITKIIYIWLSVICRHVSKTHEKTQFDRHCWWNISAPTACWFCSVFHLPLCLKT